VDIVGIVIGILGIIIGVIIAWWFYRRQKLDSERMEKNILAAVVGTVASDQQWRQLLLEEMQNPEDLVRRMIVLLKQGEIFWPELGVVAHSLIKAGNTLSEIIAQRGDATLLMLHGKVRNAFAAEEELERKLKKIQDE
jgi:hypothetical protein